MVLSFGQLIAEFIGLILHGICRLWCCVVVDTKKGHVIVQTGISIEWGLVGLVMVYTIGHISGAWPISTLRSPIH
ncbi:putative aquaporin [Helianthus anomalus]